jgi:hypothetical protein
MWLMKMYKTTGKLRINGSSLSVSKFICPSTGPIVIPHQESLEWMDRRAINT